MENIDKEEGEIEKENVVSNEAEEQGSAKPAGDVEEAGDN